MKRIHIFFTALISLVLLSTALVTAQPRHHGQHPFFENLTAEQQQILHETIKDMREQGASREEIHEAVKELFDEWGIEMPERPGHHQGPGFGDQLTGEQKETLKNTIRELREQGASRKEIHAAVKELFEAWGIEMPQRPPGSFDLPEGTKQELRQYIRSLRKQGLSRQEIREAVREWLQEHGETVKTENSGIKAYNAPNPFNPSTRINYSLDEPAQVSVKIFNINGQLIRSYEPGVQSSGSHSIQWNGLDEAGQRVTSGTYLYHVTIGDESITNRMLLLK